MKTFKSLGFRIVMVLSALASSALVLEAGQRWQTEPTPSRDFGLIRRSSDRHAPRRNRRAARPPRAALRFPAQASEPEPGPWSAQWTR